MPEINPRDVTFLELRDSVLCSECELISYNNTARCLACGSRAVLSLSRVLGGSLRGEQTVRIVAEEPLKSVIQMPPPRIAPPHEVAARFREAVPHPISRCGTVELAAMPCAEVAGSSPAHAAMKLVVERGYRISRCGGAAIAAARRGQMLCEARMGDSAPPLGAEVHAGLSGISVRTGRTLRCDVAPDDCRVDAASCRALAVNSIVAAPIANLDRVLGLVTVFSPQPYAFDDRDVAVVQWLAGMMAVVFTSASAGPSFFVRSTTRAELPGASS